MKSLCNQHRSAPLADSLPALALVAVCGLATMLGGCRGDREDAPPHQFFPDLDDQQKWKPQSQTEFYSDGRTMRQPVAGTIPFSREPFVTDKPWAAHWNTESADFVHDDPAFDEGLAGSDADGKPIFIATIPASITVDKALLLRGQNRFNIYCSVCHGYQGDGKGQVAPYYSPTVVNLHDATFFDPKNVRSQDGWIFHTIRDGKPAGAGGKMNMPAYGHALNVRDAWAVVAYVRALQDSQRGTIEDVPAALRDNLNRNRAPALPGSAPGTPAPANAPATPGEGGTK